MNAPIFEKKILNAEKSVKTAELLQSLLPSMVDLALLLKQAHWNVIGKHFRSVHLQLDEIIEDVRKGSDEVAERIVTLGVPADGRVKTVAAESQLPQYPEGFVQDTQTLQNVVAAMHKAVLAMRTTIDEIGEIDPVSEDLLIGIAGDMEKHLWMLQAQLQ